MRTAKTIIGVDDYKRNSFATIMGESGATLKQGRLRHASAFRASRLPKFRRPALDYSASCSSRPSRLKRVLSTGKFERKLAFSADDR